MKRGSVTKAEGQTHKDLASRHCVDYTSLGENNSPSFQGDGENNATKISPRSHSPGLVQRGEELHNRPEKRNPSREGKKEKPGNDFPTLCGITREGLCTREKTLPSERWALHAGRGAAAAAPGGTGSHHCCADPAHNRRPVLPWKAGAFCSHILPFASQEHCARKTVFYFYPTSPQITWSPNV